MNLQDAQQLSEDEDAFLPDEGGRLRGFGWHWGVKDVRAMRATISQDGVLVRLGQTYPYDDDAFIDSAQWLPVRSKSGGLVVVPKRFVSPSTGSNPYGHTVRLKGQ